MIDEAKMEVLNQQFQRIFTLPVTRLTFRELQNAISMALNEDNEAAKTIIETLLSQRTSNIPHMESFFKSYAVPFRVAKQIHDNGELLSMLTTDIGTSGENLIFQARMRRIDGGEFTFLTDGLGFLQVAEHIASRLHAVKESPAGKALINQMKPKLEALEKSIHKLIT